MDGRLAHRRSLPALSFECLEERLLLTSGLRFGTPPIPPPDPPLVLVRDVPRHAESRGHASITEVFARVDAKLAAVPELEKPPTAAEVEQVLDHYPRLESRLQQALQQFELVCASASAIVRLAPSESPTRILSPTAEAQSPRPSPDSPVVPPLLADAAQPSALRVDAQRPGPTNTTFVRMGPVNEEEDSVATLVPPRTLAPSSLPGPVELHPETSAVTPILRGAAAATGPLLENLPLDLAALTQSADAFFARLTDLDRTAHARQWTRHLLPCGAALAATALVYAHWRDRQDRRRLALAGDATFDPTASLPEVDR